MRILGIDLGSKRIGLAVSDELQLTAQGIAVLHRKSLSKDLEYLKEVCRQYGVEEIVLGHPLLMDGTRGEAASEAEKFREKLVEYLELPVHLWDERMTTGSAEKTLLEADMSRQKRKEVIDKISAVFILESYLYSKHD